MADGVEYVRRKAQVTFEWADGTYTFRLPRKQLEELQELCDAGPAWISARIESGSWRFKDIREPIRLGLIGGGKTAEQARKLVELYVDPPVPLMENLRPAQLILSAVLVGVEDEPPKKAEGAEEMSQPLTNRSPTVNSDSLLFTAGTPSLE